MTETVFLFVFDSLADWEPGFAIAGINNQDMQQTPGRYRVVSFSPDGAPVTTAGGLRIVPEMAMANVDPAQGAMLILPGGSAWDEGEHGKAAALAKRFVDAGKPVAAICGATAGLAKAGLLDGRAHTSNARDYLEATDYAGLAHYKEAPAVREGKVITASGLAPLEFAREIFAELDLYTPAMLDAWYGLFSTRKPEYFAAMVAAGA
jgi:putative intracellular protease/amidase